MYHVLYLAYKPLRDPTVILRLTSDLDLDMSGLQSESNYVSSRNAACTPLCSVVSNVSNVSIQGSQTHRGPITHLNTLPPSPSTSSHTNDGCEVAVRAACSWFSAVISVVVKEVTGCKDAQNLRWQSIHEAYMLMTNNCYCQAIQNAQISSLCALRFCVWMVCLASSSSGGSS